MPLIRSCGQTQGSLLNKPSWSLACSLLLLAFSAHSPGGSTHGRGGQRWEPFRDHPTQTPPVCGREWVSGVSEDLALQDEGEGVALQCLVFSSCVFLEKARVAGV